MNNPAALEKGEQEWFLGVSTGIQPKVNSLDAQGQVIYKDEFKLVLSLHIGGRFRVADKFTLGAQ